MSTEEKELEHLCDIHQGCDAISMVIEPREKDLGGFSVRRLLPVAQCRSVGPWVFFDHMGPATFKPGSGVNVRPHPHVNLATVTYLFEGEILHRDSLGSYQPIRPGDINLMVAGKGIVHSERERPEVTAVEHSLNGLQLWLALPEKDEEMDPAFYHYPANEIPSLTMDGVKIRVIMGTAFGVTSPVKTFADTLYVEATLGAGQSLTIPVSEESAIYIASGLAEIGRTALKQYSMTVLTQKAPQVITAKEETRIAIIGGESLPKRYMEWNFVSSRQARIEQAKSYWQAGRFPNVSGDEEEYIPLPS